MENKDEMIMLIEGHAYAQKPTLKPATRLFRSEVTARNDLDCEHGLCADCENESAGHDNDGDNVLT